ncbi:MAG: GNAT family protein [Succiniclasticum sp.]
MLKDYEIDKPILETDRLIIRTLNVNDVADLKEWLGREEIYTYWGRKASKNEKNPELMFGPDPRPWVKRKPSPDFDWGIVLKESNKVVGMIAVFDIQNARMGDIGYRVNPEYWNMGITTEALKEVVRFIFENTEIDRLNGRADVRNIASNKVMEKCGFIKEGTVRQGKMVSVYCDYNIYGMLRDDYVGLQGINSQVNSGLSD